MFARHQRAHIALVASVLVLAGCSASRTEDRLSVTRPAAPVSGDQVSIEDFAFVPATLTIAVGGTVTWTNHDEDPHTVAADDGSFHSPAMGGQATYSHTFSAAGTFNYVCSVHPFMRGTVVVTR